MIWYLEQKDCLKHLPSYYEDFAQVVTLQLCADALLEKMRSQMEGIIAGRFLEGEMEYPIEQYEKLFSLEKAPGMSLEERKARIRSAWLGRVPINQRTVEVCSKAYFDGKGTVRLRCDSQKLTLEILYRAETDDLDVKGLEEKLKDMVPANLELKVSYDYFLWEDAAALTWEQAQKGSWNDLYMRRI